MAGRGDARKRARAAVVPAALFGALLYLGYHTLHGERGLFAWMRTNGQVEDLTGELAEARAERAALEHRVRGLRPDSLDPDLLEERARAVLNLGHPDDLVILEPGTDAR